MVASLTGGLLMWLGSPADVTQAISPLSTLRTDRNAALVRGVILALLFGLSLGIVGLSLGIVGLGSSPIAFLTVLAAVGLAVPLGLLSITLSAWMRLQLARAYLAVLGRLPWRLMRFLGDAHARGVLRQAGAAYQFRHVRLQERLAARPEDATGASAVPGPRPG